MNFKIKLLKVKPINSKVSLFTFTKPLDFKFIPGHSAMVSINKNKLEDSRIPLTFISRNEDENLEFIIKNYPSKLTEEFHKLQFGDEVTISAVFGSIRYTKPGIFIVSGIGIAPVLSILRTLSKEELQNCKLVYSNKKETDILYKKELISLLGQENCFFVLSQENKEGYLHGRINDKLLKTMIKDNEQTYITGSEEFIANMKTIISKIKNKDI